MAKKHYVIASDRIFYVGIIDGAAVVMQKVGELDGPTPSVASISDMAVQIGLRNLAEVPEERRAEVLNKFPTLKGSLDVIILSGEVANDAAVEAIHGAIQSAKRFGPPPGMDKYFDSLREA